MRSMWLWAIFMLVSVFASAQENAVALESSSVDGSSAATANPYEPITTRERVAWIGRGNATPRSLGVGVFVATWQTGWNSPQEWGRTWSGFGKRYLEREAHIAISNSIEAGLGALWGEDPRYVKSQEPGMWPRARHAVESVIQARRRDGRAAPAWGRYAGNVVSNAIENAWLPATATTGDHTTVRIVNGFLGRMVGNLWEEFWPDVRHRLSTSP